MAKMIFVNLPVADVAASTAFYEAIGATRNTQFSNESVSAMVFSDTITVMLLSHGRFADFTSKPIVDAKASTEVLVCLSEDSREAVRATTEKAIAAGGKADPSPVQDHGFMYGRSFEDLDGHIFELMWLDLPAMQAAMSEAPRPPSA